MQDTYFDETIAVARALLTLVLPLAKLSCVAA
jgi:hypothetical protein